jgi:uncharacterized protein (TIGR02594 family)
MVIGVAAGSKTGASQRMGNVMRAVIVKSRSTKRNAAVLSAAYLGFLLFSGAALGNPATPDSRNRAEPARAAQQRHARPAPDAARLKSTPAVGTQRPMFGWPKLVTEARKYVGTNPTARKKLWCATFMNMVLARTGYSGTGSDAARSFASYGKRIDEPRVGAIAVLTRGKNGGHVGIVTGVDANGNPIIISGNHGKRVGEATYSRNRVIAYVMPAVDRMGTTQLASAGPALPQRASDADQDGGIPSPIEELLAAINAERGNEQRPQAAREPARQNERAAQRPAERVVARAQASVPRANERPTNYRVVQQTADIELPRPRVDSAMRLSAVVPGTPLPRERAAQADTPTPRSRPQ